MDDRRIEKKGIDWPLAVIGATAAFILMTPTERLTFFEWLERTYDRQTGEVRTKKT